MINEEEEREKQGGKEATRHSEMAICKRVTVSFRGTEDDNGDCTRRRVMWKRGVVLCR